MKTIGLYLLFVISLAGMILCDDPFNEESIKQFLGNIFDLHNRKRLTHRLPLLQRNNNMDIEAHEVLIKYLFEGVNSVPVEYGVNFFKDKYNNNTTLSSTVADHIFSRWYTIIIAPNDPSFREKAGSHQIVWENTEEIGLAFLWNDEYYAVIALYSPRFISSTQGQVSSDDSIHSFIDEDEPCII